MSKVKTIIDLVGYFWNRKKYWLIPIIILLALFAFIIVISESSAVGSFIYTLF